MPIIIRACSQVPQVPLATRHLLDTVGATEMGEFKDHHIVVFGREEKIEIGEFEPYKIGAYLDDDESMYHHGKYAPYVAPIKKPEPVPAPEPSELQKVEEDIEHAAETAITDVETEAKKIEEEVEHL